MFCLVCGAQLPDGARYCGACGRLVEGAEADPLPPGVKRWSWGAFLLNWIWAIGNNTWIGLLALIPFVGFFVRIWLGFKGRELAWKNGKWDSFEHFDKVQRNWSRWAVGIFLSGVFLVLYGAHALFPPTGKIKRNAVDSYNNTTRIQEVTEVEAPSSMTPVAATMPKLLSTPVRTHFYSLYANGEYGYEEGLSEDDQKRGTVTKPLFMIRYLGQRDGSYMVERREDNVRMIFSCKAPCEFVTISAVLQEGVVKEERLKKVPGSIVHAVMEDAMSGELVPYKIPVLVGSSGGDARGGPRITAAKADIWIIVQALKLYKLDNESYPTTEQGLQALVQKPTTGPIAVGWKEGGYLEEFPKDPWGNPYLYRSPGNHGEVDVFSLGADGRPGGTGEDADIGSWEL